MRMVRNRPKRVEAGAVMTRRCKEPPFEQVL